MLNTHVLFFPLSFDFFHISRVSPLESQKRTCTVLTFLPRILDVAQTEITTKDLYVKESVWTFLRTSRIYSKCISRANNNNRRFRIFLHYPDIFLKSWRI